MFLKCQTEIPGLGWRARAREVQKPPPQPPSQLSPGNNSTIHLWLAFIFRPEGTLLVQSSFLIFDFTGWLEWRSARAKVFGAGITPVRAHSLTIFWTLGLS